MTSKKAGANEKGVLDSQIKKLMTPQAIKELSGLTPAIQQFLLRWQEADHMILSDELKVELKEFLQELHLTENKQMCKDIAEVIQAQNVKMFGSLDKIEKMVEGVAADISVIKKDIIDIKKRLGEVEVKVTDEEARIERLEKTQRWWNIGLRIAIAVLISAIVTIFLLEYTGHSIW